MRLLLDTHVWVWSVALPDELSPVARDAIESGEHAVHLSPISFWEIAMLVERGRLDVDGDLDGWFAFALGELPATEVPLTSAIATSSRHIGLPHRDPADRFLAATALVHDLTLVTRDRRLLDAAGVPTLAA